ncbi:kinase-like protein [Favolaschia claudopus]|uniref:mitogen-activated protein kinase kinase n=1 Tax=Favolaschia claudopus TaxID=2862362 RepID=A0AAW0EDC1_9AGAR
MHKPEPSSDTDEHGQRPLIGAVSTNSAWRDDDFDVVDCLDERNGAVYEVREKATGKIMVRRTFTVYRGVPPRKQLLHDLLLISNEHPNIISFYGAYMLPSSRRIEILTEFAEGRSLEDIGARLKERNAILGERIGERIAGNLVEGVLQGLAYLQSKKTTHRNIHPSNILVTRTGVIKLCDSIALASLERLSEGSRLSSNMTFYMAPERILGENHTIRADVWSTGLCLLELAQQRYPYSGELSILEVLQSIVNDKPPQLEDEPGMEWSDDMKDFIKQMLTVDVQTRPTPMDLLAHPWVVDTSSMKQKIDMEKWIRQLWGWPRPRDDQSVVR